MVLDHNTVIFQKQKGGGGTYKNHWYVKVDRNKIAGKNTTIEGEIRRLPALNENTVRGEGGGG